MFSNGDDFKIGSPAIDGLDVEVKVLAHRRGPRIETIRYKSKKRVRVHRGGRADLTALEIIAVGGIKAEPKETVKADVKTATKARTKTAGRPRAKAEAKKEPVVAAAEVPEIEPETEEAKPAKRATRKKETK
jgi:large subunit ribosomal protein L21